MYKIYINQTAIRLAHSSEGGNLSSTKTHLVARYTGTPNFLLNYIDMAEKTDRYQDITIYAKDQEQLIQDFFKLFKVVEAAGGLVFNHNDEVLMIYRRGSWDLPKGKIDPGETPDIAAVREVQEETGLKNITLGPLIHTSYHTYRNRKDKRCLKPTYWYDMTTKDTELIPQTEEDIEKAVWITIDDFKTSGGEAYRSILDVLNVGKG